MGQASSQNFQLVYDGDISKLQEILPNNPDLVNMEDQDGTTLLMVASSVGKVDVVSLLLDNGATINGANDLGETVLMKAMNFPNVISLLLDRGANIDMRRKDGCTTLMVACILGSVDVVVLLLDRGSDPTLCDDMGNTPLMHACRNGHRTIARLLLEQTAGHNANNQNKEGSTALMAACYYGKLSTIQLLIEYRVNLNIQDKKGQTALSSCLQAGDMDLVLTLLDAGADTNTQDLVGDTPLIRACRDGHQHLIDLLLTNIWTNVDIQNNAGETALMVAIQRLGSADEKLVVVNQLIDRQANLNLLNKGGKSPFSMAVTERGLVAIGKKLVDAGATVSNKDRVAVISKPSLATSKTLISSLTRSFNPRLSHLPPSSPFLQISVATSPTEKLPETNEYSPNKWTSTTNYMLDADAFAFFKYILQTSKESYVDDICYLIRKHPKFMSFVANSVDLHTGKQMKELMKPVYYKLILENKLFLKRYEFLDEADENGDDDFDDFPLILQELPSSFLAPAASIPILGKHILHRSDHSIIKLAKDTKTQNQLVAIKFIKYKNHYLHEVKLRHYYQFNEKLILKTYEMYSADENTEFHQEAEEKEFYRYCIVMPVIQKNLNDILQHGNLLGGKDWGHLIYMTRMLLENLLSLHDLGLVHGNLKPSNIVYYKKRLVLIDLAAMASTNNITFKRHNGPFCLSTGFVPPEMLYLSGETSTNPPSAPNNNENGLENRQPYSLAGAAAAGHNDSITPVEIGLMTPVRAQELGMVKPDITPEPPLPPSTPTARETPFSGRISFKLESSIPMSPMSPLVAVSEDSNNHHHLSPPEQTSPTRGQKEQSDSQTTAVPAEAISPERMLQRKVLVRGLGQNRRSSLQRKRLSSGVGSTTTGGSVGIRRKTSSTSVISAATEATYFTQTSLQSTIFSAFTDPEVQSIPIDKKQDMWALGAILFWMFSGEHLFPTNFQGNISQDSLWDLYLWSDDFKNSRLALISNSSARNLVARLLVRDPLQRPDAHRLLSHPFLTNKRVIRMIGEEPVYDVCISYRMESDNPVDFFVAEVLNAILTGQGLCVWWDDKGYIAQTAKWEESMFIAIMRSRVFVPLLSRDAIKNPDKASQNFETLAPNSEIDQLYLSFRLALELRSVGIIEAIYPVMIGDVLQMDYSNDNTLSISHSFSQDSKDENGIDTNNSALHSTIYSNYFNSGCHPTNVIESPVHAIEEKVAYYMDKQSLGSPMHVHASVRYVLDLITTRPFEGCFLEGRGAEAVDTICHSIIKLLDNRLKRNSLLTSPVRHIRFPPEPKTPTAYDGISSKNHKLKFFTPTRPSGMNKVLSDIHERHFGKYIRGLSFEGKNLSSDSNEEVIQPAENNNNSNHTNNNHNKNLSHSKKKTSHVTPPRIFDVYPDEKERKVEFSNEHLHTEEEILSKTFEIDKMKAYGKTEGGGGGGDDDSTTDGGSLDSNNKRGRSVLGDIILKDSFTM